MWFIDKRIQVICEELKRLSVVKKLPIRNLQYKKGQYFYPWEAEQALAPWEDFIPGNMKWYGPDQHYWFRTTYTVPEELDGKTLRLHVKTQIEEWDDAKNPQFLLFAGGKILQGMDMNHRSVQLTGKAQAGECWELDMQAYTGTLHSEFDMIAEIWQVDVRLEKLYYDLVVPLQAFGRMEKEDKVRLDLETVLNETVNLLDLRNPYSSAFYESVERASAYLKEALYEAMGGYEEVIATCIGHTHIDVAWWWTVEQTREKVARSFATVLKLMEEYPNYKFMSSQPQLYLFLKERYPELYEKIKDRVREGRWEPEGGMWLEADTNLTSGESLVRQFLYGKKFFQEEFGTDNRILWLPDVFGYSGALPQIMKKCGIDYFMTTKLSWNQVDQMPYDTFLWKGIDGTEVFTHLVTTLGVGQSTDDFFTTYNGVLHPDSIMGGWKRYQNKDINNDILISYGYGDGGGGPTREMLETSLRMEKGIQGIPRVRQEFSGTYFKELFDRVKGKRRLPTWEGELYFEYHRGTYTSMARNKRANRKCEFLMMNLEFFSLLASWKGIAYPKEEIDRMWKVILLNQFHDILPGTSIHQVYEVTKREYEELEETGSKLVKKGMEVLADGGNAITVFNTLGFDRDDLLHLPKGMKGVLKDREGNIYPVQELQDCSIAYVKGIPSKGLKSFETEREEASGCARETGSPFVRKGNQLETPYYIVKLDENGLFASVYDKKNKREVLKEGTKGNLFRMYEDKPIYYDNWDIDIYHTEKSWDVTELSHMVWKEEGPVCIVLEMERPVSKSLIRQKIYFYGNSPRIDFETYVDWKEHQHLLKVHFPVDIHSDEASFDIQFGNLTRKVHTNTSWDMARFESCGQKWMDFSEGHYGVSLLNDCKYGHSVKDSVMGLTLIKSGIEPNPVTDQEEHLFTYSLYPHAGNLRECDVVKEGYKLNVPLLFLEAGEPGRQESLLQVDASNVMVETVKEAENGEGMIIRMYEYENAKTHATLTLGMGKRIKRVYECNLLETREREVTEHRSQEFEFVIKPFEIKTYEVVFESLS
ncbi:alpha-mannosidase [Lacrimispora sp. BS-2]|uniref:Alpha-mannosidase n=1 Tax=Lacrimispora sp. BS-2 TaxID=3151850 RepID=A0AAU7PRF9_9FIRM